MQSDRPAEELFDRLHKLLAEQSRDHRALFTQLPPVDALICALSGWPILCTSPLKSEMVGSPPEVRDEWLAFLYAEFFAFFTHVVGHETADVYGSNVSAHLLDLVAPPALEELCRATLSAAGEDERWRGSFPSTVSDVQQRVAAYASCATLTPEGDFMETTSAVGMLAKTIAAHLGREQSMRFRFAVCAIGMYPLMSENPTFLRLIDDSAKTLNI